MEILIRRKHGQMNDQQWNMLCSLDTHLDDFRRAGTYDNIHLMAMGVQKFSGTEREFPLSFVEGMYGRVSICLTDMTDVG